MTKLHDLYALHGQSPWLDNLRRQWIHNGRLEQWIDDGIRGITSNPTIFAKAIEGEDDYDEQFADLVRSRSVEDCYWELVIADVTAALELMAPLHKSSGGGDGFVSLEVAPGLAHDQRASEAAARSLHERICLPNLLVKIPATVQGVPAIRTMIGEGRSINVTLIFSVERYREVADAYLGGLEDRLASGGPGVDLSAIHSVASFFVSRVDTEVDRRLETLADAAGSDTERQALLGARGKAALFQAKLAYEAMREIFSGERWEALVAQGANLQRPLWASTSTKNPAYPDLCYVDGLIGPDTVNTMPDQTVEAFLDHGTLARTVDADLDTAHRHFDLLAELGVDMADVARTLEDEGVAAFSKSFDELLQVLSDKAAALDRGA